jgi:hypothetical protein
MTRWLCRPRQLGLLVTITIVVLASCVEAKTFRWANEPVTMSPF